MSKIDTQNRPPTRDEVRNYILSMVEELGDLANAYGHAQLGEALRAVERQVALDPASLDGHV